LGNQKKLRGIYMLGSTEMMIIVLVVLVLFGATAIPKFAKSLGQAKKEFQKGIKEGEDITMSKSTEKENK
jgi:sec-independent protein translocase protein TatA